MGEWADNESNWYLQPWVHYLTKSPKPKDIQFKDLNQKKSVNPHILESH